MATTTRDDFIQLCFETNGYLNALQVVAPHILRYLTVAVVTSRKRKNYLKEMVKIIKIEEYNYADPITELLMCLYVKYDFDGAQEKLRECHTVMTTDFFVSHLVDDFIENARQLVFEMFCRIHQKISITFVDEIFNQPTHSELQNARVEAEHGRGPRGALAGESHPQRANGRQDRREQGPRAHGRQGDVAARAGDGEHEAAVVARAADGHNAREGAEGENGAPLSHRLTAAACRARRPTWARQASRSATERATAPNRLLFLPVSSIRVRHCDSRYGFR